MNRGVAATQATPQKLRMHIPACDGSNIHQANLWLYHLGSRPAIRYLTHKTSIESKFLRKNILFLVYFKKKQ